MNEEKTWINLKLYTLRKSFINIKRKIGEIMPTSKILKQKLYVLHLTTYTSVKREKVIFVSHENMTIKDYFVRIVKVE